MDKTKLIIFDVDGTLTEGFTRQLRPGVTAYFDDTEEEPLPGAAPDDAEKRLDRLADGLGVARESIRLRPGVADHIAGMKDGRTQRPMVALATNQGGVANRHWMEQGGWGDPDKFPTQGEVEGRLAQLAKMLGIDPQLIYVCFAYKSKSGKWAPTPEWATSDPRWSHDWRKPEAGMLLQAIQDAGVRPEEALMVGDRDEDELAARRAGCGFVSAEEFFRPYVEAVPMVQQEEDDIPF